MNAVLARWGRIALVAGITALVLCAVLGLSQPAQFFRSYLIAFLMWSGVAFGSIAVLMIHHLAGGGWGYLLRRPLEAAMRTWPLVALMFVPLLAGIPYLYSWSHGGPEGAAKRIYLNVPFFVVRAVLSFSVLGLLAFLLSRYSRAQDDSEDVIWLRRLQRVSGPGLVVFALVMSFALVDWAMSIEPEWFSTIFPPIWLMGQILSALALASALLVVLGQEEPLAQLMAPKYLNDVGNMMLAFVMLWAYMQFSQLLIIWSGNMTDEIPWYLRRASGSWGVLAGALALFHFAVPFVLLLSRRRKRNVRWLAGIGVAILVVRLFDVVWMIEPTFHPSGFQFHLLDWLLPVGLGGMWIAAFFRQLRQRPLLPLHDPRLPLVLARIEHTRVGDVSYGEHTAAA